MVVLRYVMEEMTKTIGEMRSYFASGVTLPKKWRIAQLEKLQSVLKTNQDAILSAVKQDLGKSPFESYTTELGMVYGEISYALTHLSSWMRPHHVGGSLVNFPSRNYTIAEPLGVTLVMSPWNYPVQLSLSPVVAAFASGNCVVLKPSRYSAHTSAILKKILDASFDHRIICTYEGGSQVNTELLKERFDFIFFTGSTTVGKVVMEAASAYLTPVALELGGKSPAIIDRSADLTLAARRLAWGKCLNAGQTCVAPDYVLVDSAVKDRFVSLLEKEIVKMFGSDPIANDEYPHIINEKHYARLRSLLECGKVVYGGRSDNATMKISPTIVEEPILSSPLMTDEIFGPILPIIPFGKMDEALDFVRKREHPLALYLFTKDKGQIREIPKSVAYGGGCINDCVMHLASSHFAFGGVGASGMGKYHGKDGFETFSHRKSILQKGNLIDIPLRYAPFRDKLWLAKLLMK